ncbi:MAG TPA: CxxC-x17-CxxC domain-containing protein [Candidatus Nanoarchaeia archaeon]|nr:CxxC-x17-CxxC domain-containing protein [Candidatus Nanoarchaeia archaeon]
MENATSDRPMFKATCSKCNKETTVPFEPKPGREVYCQDCYKEIRNSKPRRY